LRLKFQSSIYDAVYKFKNEECGVGVLALRHAGWKIKEPFAAHQWFRVAAVAVISDNRFDMNKKRNAQRSIAACAVVVAVLATAACNRRDFGEGGLPGRQAAGTGSSQCQASR